MRAWLSLFSRIRQRLFVSGVAQVRLPGLLSCTNLETARGRALQRNQGRRVPFGLFELSVPGVIDLKSVPSGCNNFGFEVTRGFFNFSRLLR